MPEPDDLQERLAAMAERRVAGADRPAHLPARSHRRIRRGERIATGLATLVVVALVAGGVAVARSGQEQATTVRVGQSTAPECDPPAIPPGLADQVRALALLGTHVPGATPRAVVVYHPTGSRYATPSTSAGANVVPTPAEAWEVVISGEHFVPSDTSFGFRDPTPHRANSESWDLDSTLDVIGAAVPGPNATELTAMGSATPVALDHRCVPGPSSTTTLPPTGSTSSTTGVTTPGAPIGRGTPPDCTGSQLSLTAATGKASYVRGDTVSITVTIRNDGATCENASVAAALDTCPLVRVADATGHAVYDPGVFCPVPLRLAPVPAGYHRSDTFTWISGQVFPQCTGVNCAVQATPGTYTVTPADPQIDGIRIHATTIRLT